MNGQFIRKFGSKGKRNGELDRLYGIGLLSNRNIVVGEFGNNRISIFDQEGTFIKIIGAGELGNALHLFIDSDDNILIADQINTRIAIYSSQNGNLLKSIPTDDSVGYPFGITMDRDGRIIVSGATNKFAIY